MVMLTHLLRSLAQGQDGSLARRWEFQEWDPLAGTDRSLFIAIGTVALLSLVSTLSLLSFLTYRFIYWKRYYKHPLAQNQYVVLIYNLLLVDLQQSVAFLLSLYWVSKGSVHFGEAACYLQGWWIQTGDPGSGLFVLSIALHTSAVVLRGRQLPYHIFVYVVIGIWMFILVIGFIPVGLWGSKAFVISEAGWCWLSPTHENERLWGHYFWIFLSEFGTVVLYTVMFFWLRRRMRQAKMLRRGQQESLQRLNRVVVYMVIYPVVYLCLSLPLSAGRMSTMRGVPPSRTYFGVAGCLMAFSGFVDVVVYTLTRRHLLIDTEHSTTDPNYDNITESRYQTQITAHPKSRKGFGLTSRLNTRFRQDPKTVDMDDTQSPLGGSTENIVPNKDVELQNFHGVYQQTTIEILHEPATSAESVEHPERRSP